MLQLNDLQQRGNMREQEIILLVQSINDLAQVFRDLNCLVIDQVRVCQRVEFSASALMWSTNSLFS